jgi:hypothetical protein
MEVPKKVELELPHDPAIPLLSIYPKKMRSVCQRNMYLLKHYSQ